ncbi:hypothetical protein EB24_00075 [Enterococcus hirae]|uniref:hypothetical protein n=1 Tax=Enterococcus hirae TaxID=1354 RepID=UPI000DFAFEA0|nr:hypothetical protein [Enterococcus hirae]RBT52633.1 hypothetical protein EB10_01363 [Enterococcus hirae]RBT56866.1 hypothetical protein EB24_00075 [Enterococcus hirae]RBT64068.1 hypothetical protein EB39_00507 [Enterococcus hirae]
MGMFKNLFVQSDRSEIELFEVKDDANLLEIKLKVCIVSIGKNQDLTSVKKLQ